MGHWQAAARAYGAVAYPADYDALEAIKVQQSTQGPKAYATELADFKDTEAFSSNMQELVSMLQELASAVDARQAETLAKIFHRDVSRRRAMQRSAPRGSHAHSHRFPSRASSAWPQSSSRRPRPRRGTPRC